MRQATELSAGDQQLVVPHGQFAHTLNEGLTGLLIGVRIKSKYTVIRGHVNVTAVNQYIATKAGAGDDGHGLVCTGTGIITTQRYRHQLALSIEVVVIPFIEHHHLVDGGLCADLQREGQQARRE